MAVTPEDVRHVAALARLTIPETQLAGYVEQLNGILGHMDALQRVASAGAAQAADDAAEGMRLRDDAPGAIALNAQPEAFAPAVRDGFFLVPRLATHEDAGEGA